jgi:hypothetical protein
MENTKTAQCATKEMWQVEGGKQLTFVKHATVDADFV